MFFCSLLEEEQEEPQKKNRSSLLYSCYMNRRTELYHNDIILQRWRIISLWYRFFYETRRALFSGVLQEKKSVVLIWTTPFLFAQKKTVCFRTLLQTQTKKKKQSKAAKETEKQSGSYFVVQEERFFLSKQESEKEEASFQVRRRTAPE